LDHQQSELQNQNSQLQSKESQLQKLQDQLRNKEDQSKTKEIEFFEALKTAETQAKKFKAESIKWQRENAELTLELKNSRKPEETNQDLENE